jgi:fucose permease
MKRSSCPNTKVLISIAIYSQIMTFAMGYTIFGIMITQLKQSYSLSLSEAGLVTFSQYLGEFVALIFGGLFINRVRKERFITLLFCIFSIILIVIGLKLPFGADLICFVGMGMCSSLINISASSFAADFLPERRGSSLNLIHGFFGVGSIIGPIYPTIMLSHGFKWNKTYQYLGTAFLMIGIAFVVFHLISTNQKSKSSETMTQEKHFFLISSNNNNDFRYFLLLRDKRIALLCIMELLINGQQCAYNSWMPTYISDKIDGGQTLSGMTMIVYFVGIAASRLLYPVFAPKLNAKKVVAGGCMIGAVSYLAGILISTPEAIIISAFISSAATGVVFPLLMGFAADLYPERSGSVTTIMCMASSLGALLLPWTMGIAADRIGFESSMLAIGISMILVLFLLFAKPLREKTKS